MFGIVIDKTSRGWIEFYWPLMCFDTTGDVTSLELYIKAPAFIYLIVYIVSHFPGRRECQHSSTEEI